MSAPLPRITNLRRAGLVASLASAAFLNGCAQVPLGAPVASVENIQAAKAAALPATAVGDFRLAPGKDPKIDRELSLRGSTVFSPYGQSFAAYLRETLRTELAAAGLFDATSDTEIRGFLADNALDAAIGEGKGRLAARFVLVRSGRTLYDRELRVDATWESSFVGAVALPAARNEYGLLYRKLVGKLLADPAFRTAIAS